MKNVAATVGAIDVCNANPTITLFAIESNESDNGTGDGDKPNDIQGADIGTDDRAYMLRAERSGGGDGRFYTVTYDATDVSGNTAIGSATVTVPNNQ